MGKKHSEDERIYTFFSSLRTTVCDFGNKHGRQQRGQWPPGFS